MGTGLLRPPRRTRTRYMRKPYRARYPIRLAFSGRVGRGARWIADNCLYCQHLTRSKNRIESLCFLRHNSLLMSILNKHNYITILEPHIQTRNGLRKPDLIIYKNDTAYIIDTQISIDTINTNINYTKKINYYNTTAIIAYAKQITGANRIVFSASCCNWRGIPSALTTQDLIKLGLNKRNIELLSIRVIAGGLDIYRNYCRNGLM